MEVPDRSNLVYATAPTAGLGLGATPEERSAQAGRFTQRVAAWFYRTDPRWGVLEKTSGNNYQGYSVDCLAYRDDAAGLCWLVDIVRASDGPDAAPTWGVVEAPEPLSRWRISPEFLDPSAPIDPPPSPACLYVAPDLGPVAEALEALTARVAGLEQAVAGLVVTVPSVKFPDYEGTLAIPFFGSKTITLRPKP
jgi:hypothetical protein